MTGERVFDAALWAWLGVAVLTFLSLFFVTAPYGRHARRGWGPAIPARIAWCVMELPAVVLMAALFATGNRTADPVSITFLVVWELHYLQRTFVFPALMKPTATPMPFLVVLFAFVFNLFNGWFNGRYLFALSPVRDASWLLDPRCLVGLGLFLAGFVVNLQSDAILRGLRKPGETGYKIPRGGLYRLVSCPNYLGEIMEWAGWALATWSLPGLAFLIWTVANLLPRAVANHRWYRTTFPDYPVSRRAVIPFLV